MANNSPITDKEQQKEIKWQIRKIATPQQNDPQKPGSEQKFGIRPNPPTQHQQQDPAGPKSPQSEQEKHDQKTASSDMVVGCTHAESQGESQP